MASTIGKGECDACPKTDVDLYQTGNMTLCVSCYEAEIKAIGDTKWINHALANAKAIDTKVELKADIFNAATVPFVELQAAIRNDASIPAAKKNEVFVQQCEARIKHLSEVIFAEEQATNIKKNERYSWSQQIRTFINTLQEAERAKFKQYNVDYAPKTITKREKSTKSTTPNRKKSTAAKFDMAACKAAASKYDVPLSGVQAWYVQKKGEVSYEDCAKQLAEMLK